MNPEQIAKRKQRHEKQRLRRQEKKKATKTTSAPPASSAATTAVAGVSVADKKADVVKSKQPSGKRACGQGWEGRVLNRPHCCRLGEAGTGRSSSRRKQEGETAEAIMTSTDGMQVIVKHDDK